jgi:hypothetical protein
MIEHKEQNKALKKSTTDRCGSKIIFPHLSPTTPACPSPEESRSAIPNQLLFPACGGLSDSTFGH